MKTDALGRVHTPKARREALLAEFERSGVSGKKFAALVGVNYQTFASWVQQWRRQRGASPAAAKGAEMLRLVEAVVEAGSDEVGAVAGREVLRVELPGGAWVEIGGGRQVVLAAALLRALAPGEGGPC